MKHIINVFVILLLLSSCAKQEDIISELKEATVTFTIGNVQSGNITKGPQDILSATQPTGPFTIKLASTTNSDRKYTITAGEATAIILDTYTVTCKYTPSVKATGIGAKLFLEPSFYINTEINITEETSVISLQAEYTCIALIQDKTSTSKYTYSNEPGNQADLAVQTSLDDYAVTYILCESQWTASYGFSIVSVPVDEVNFTPTKYQFITDTQTVSDGQVYVEKGKWYIFHPDAAETSSGTIGIDFPEWIAGNTE